MMTSNIPAASCRVIQRREIYNPGRAGELRKIEYGDRVTVRLVRNGETVLEMATDRVGDYSELLVEVRRQTRGLNGLGRIQVRNYSRGWRRESPYMFGAGVGEPRKGFLASLEEDAARRAAAPTKPARRMLCPWETH